MKTLVIPGILLAATLASQAAVLVGDVIAIDFGSTATAEANWNTSVVSSTTNLKRLSDGANTGVGLTITNVAGTFSANNSVFQDGSAQGGSSVSTIYSDGIISAGTGDNQFNLVFTGLDDSLTYTLFAGGKTGSDFGADWDISTSADGGTNQETRFQNTNSYVLFTGITSVGNTFTLSLNDISNAAAPADGRNIGLNELRLTVVPEPSSIALLGLGAAGLMLRRRRSA